MKRCGIKHIKERNNNWGFWIWDVYQDVCGPLFAARVYANQYGDQVFDLDALITVQQMRKLAVVARIEGQNWLHKQYRKADLEDGYLDQGSEVDRAFPEVPEVPRFSYFLFIKKLEELTLHFLSNPWGTYNPVGHAFYVQKYIEKMKTIQDPMPLGDFFDACVQ